jgi:hypothetical protein
MIFIWAAFARMLAMRPCPPSRLKRDALSWAATSFALASALYPLRACRFIIYEETICYLVLCELVALGFYLFALRSWGLVTVCGMGAASGFGLLVRPTGLIYMIVWGALTLAGSHRTKTKLGFSLTIAPFLAFWMYTNWVRTGSPVELGFFNTVVNDVSQTRTLRFGSPCVDSLQHIADLAKWLFLALFVFVREDLPRWMQSCHFQFEERPPAAHEPFLGPTMLALLAWILLHHVARRERRIALYAPFAAVVFLFADYVYAGAGFAWRYVGDFWPLIVLICAQYVHGLPEAANNLLGIPLAVVLTLASIAGCRRSLDPWHAGGYYGDHWETLPPSDARSMWDSFVKSRWNRDNVLPSRMRCGDHVEWPSGNAQGWGSDCNTDVITNLFLGVPRDAGDERYEIRMETQDINASRLFVYVNGRTYAAHREANGYRASVRIPYQRLYSSIVMVTVEWTRGFSPWGKLLSIELA